MGNPLIAHQQSLGNQAVQRMLRSHVIQAKLTINEPGDEYEQEADRVAEQVMQGPGLQTRRGDTSSTLASPARTQLQRKCACGGTPGPDGECAECRAKRLGLQRYATGSAAPVTAPPVVRDVLDSPGQPLDPATRAFMEPRFGYDLSRVRVHTDTLAAESARAVGARAYTVGHDVVFATGQYTTGAPSGQRLLAHELAHVVQQRSVTPTAHLAVGKPGSSVEQEARTAAVRASRGQPTGGLSRARIPSVQRAEIGETGGVSQATTPGVRSGETRGDLGFLDSPVTDVVASQAIGSTQWQLLREGLRGVVEGVQGQPPERIDRIIARFAELIRSPRDLWDYYQGYFLGIGEGLWDSLKGIFDLLMLGPRVQKRALDWLLSEGPRILENFDHIRAEVLALRDRLGEIAETISAKIREFLDNPAEGIQAIRTLLAGLMESAQEKMREAGRSVAASIFDFLELPWQQFGRKIGYVVGFVLFQVLLAVATKGIANALTTIGSAFARGARLVAQQALRLFRWLGEIALKLWGMLKSLGPTVLKFLGRLPELLLGLFERVVELVRWIRTAARPLVGAAMLAVTPARIPPGLPVSTPVAALVTPAAAVGAPAAVGAVSAPVAAASVPAAAVSAPVATAALGAPVAAVSAPAAATVSVPTAVVGSAVPAAAVSAPAAAVSAPAVATQAAAVAAATTTALGTEVSQPPGSKPKEPPPEITLRLPRQKAVHVPLYEGLIRERRLVHFANKKELGPRKTRQRAQWHNGLKPGGDWAMYQEIWNAFDRIGIDEERRTKPNWSKTREYPPDRPMEVDHKLDWQVWPPGEDDIWDDFNNYELLDYLSNESAGSQLRWNIVKERETLAARTKDPTWMTRVLVFTRLELSPGGGGERWSLEEIHRGEHYDAWRRLKGETR